MAGAEVPVGIRTHLTHAAVQALGDRCGVRLLHLKGPAMDDSLSEGRLTSRDADILADAHEVERLRAAMLRAGWNEIAGFASGSPFQHAATFHHDYWGYVDLHRAVPGFRADAFEALWSRHSVRQIAHVDCAVPDVDAQRVILLSHYARGGRQIDFVNAWESADTQTRDRVRSRAAELGAELALAAAIGELDDYPEAPGAALWRAVAGGGTRLDEWRARWRATNGLGNRVALLGRMLRLNRDHLRIELGHEPSRSEVAAAWRRRVRRAWTALRGRTR